METIKKQRKSGRNTVRALKLVWAYKGDIYTLYKLGTGEEVQNYFTNDPFYMGYKNVPSTVELEMRKMGMIVAFVKWVPVIEAIKDWSEDETKRIEII